MQTRYTLDIGKYLLATLVDLLAFYCLTALSVLCTLMILGLISSRPTDSVIGGLIIVVVFLMWAIYFIVSLKTAGQTLAMKLFRFKTVPTVGNSLSTWAAVVWGLTLSNPVTAILSVVVGCVPPHTTLAERFTNTELTEVQESERQ